MLADRISTGHWRAGDRLPSEADLCNSLNIGRSTLREALKSLAFVGMVQMRPGEGTYVLGSAHGLVNRVLGGGSLRTEKELHNLAEARVILETEVAALAAERIGPADLEAIEGILAEMERSLKTNFRPYADLDVEFHLAVAKASKNRVLAELLVPMRGMLQEFIAKSQQLPGITQSAHEHHIRIVESLRNHDAEKARRVMRAHLSTCEKAFTLLGKLSDTTAGV